MIITVNVDALGGRQFITCSFRELAKSACAKLILEHFATGVERKQIDKCDVLRDLVIGHTLARLLNEFLLTHRLLCAEHHESMADFSETMIGLSNNCYLGD